MSFGEFSIWTWLLEWRLNSTDKKFDISIFMGLFFRETWISFLYFFGFHLSVTLITKFSHTLWKTFILKNDSIFKMSCSFFSEDWHCGPAPGKEDITTVPVKSCANNIFDHLSRVHNRGSQIPLSRLFFFSIPPSRPILRPNPDPVPFFYEIFCLIIEIDVI